MHELLNVSENKFTKTNVLNMEFQILKALDFDFTQPSIYRFLERFRKISPVNNDDQTFYFAQYIAEICLLDTYLLKYRPSEIAAASLILAAGVTKNSRMIWNKDMEKISGMKLDNLIPAVEDVRDFA
jgi:cyclin A